MTKVIHSGVTFKDAVQLARAHIEEGLKVVENSNTKESLEIREGNKSGK